MVGVGNNKWCLLDKDCAGDGSGCNNVAAGKGALGAFLLDGGSLRCLLLFPSWGNASLFQGFHPPLFLLSNFLPSAA